MDRILAKAKQQKLIAEDANLSEQEILNLIFEPARFDVEILDRFGRPVVPREWFMVPIFTIDEVVARIRDGSIVDYIYDPKNAALTLRSPKA